jgi:hypothetical protein
MNIPIIETVTLDTPLKRGEQLIEKVTLRKPMSGELRGLSLNDILQNDVLSLQKVIPRISTPMLTEQDVANLDPADLMQMGSKISYFLVPKAMKLDSPTT